MAAAIQRGGPVMCRSLRNNISSVRNLAANKIAHEAPFKYCQELVRKHDYENFLASLILPIGARESAIAVRAFNVSVAQVEDQVSQGTIGQMRLKFWVDTLETVYQNTPPAHPVATQLSKAVQKHKLNKRWLQRLINSREEHLSIKSFESVAALETYAENSVSSVLYLTLECLSIRNVHADHAASHIGRAQGLATLLRAIPYQAQRNKVYIPFELLVKYKVSQNELIRGSNEKKIKDLVFDLASTANAHVEKARSLMNTVPKEAKVGLMTAVSTVSYLERLRRVDFNIYDGRLMERNNLLPWLFWWNNFRNKF